MILLWPWHPAANFFSIRDNILFYSDGICNFHINRNDWSAFISCYFNSLFSMFPTEDHSGIIVCFSLSFLFLLIERFKKHQIRSCPVEVHFPAIYETAFKPSFLFPVFFICRGKSCLLY